MWCVMRGVLSFTEGLGYHPTVWTAVLMVQPVCNALHTFCNRQSAGRSDGHVRKTEVKTFIRLAGPKAGIQLN